MSEHRESDRVLGTAAAHVTTAVPVTTPGTSVARVLADLRGQRFDSASIVAVIDEERLLGLVTIERLLAAPADADVLDVADREPPVVTPEADQEQAAWTTLRRGETGLAVVTADGTFTGLISPQQLLAILLAEHDEDLARLGGFLGSAATARAASEEPVSRRLWHRLPWLLLGLLGALLSAGIVDAFEGDLQRTVLLAFFVPGVVYLADAVGTQTETLVIRGLSVGVSIGQVAVRELVTGLLVGVLLALVVLPLAIVLWHDAAVAVAVALALLAACSIASVIAMALPWVFHRLGRDPAFGSGPLATVVQDLLSLVVYFAIARAALG